jgi:hypothetical protein
MAEGHRAADRGLDPGRAADPRNTLAGLSFSETVRTFSEHFSTNQIGCFARSACGQRVKWPILQYITEP